MKTVKFLGSSQDDLRTFPYDARHTLGVELMRVQFGAIPHDWKPFATVGSGACEIRYRDASGAWRVIYVAKFADAVYVLHTFQKKTAKTAKADVDLAIARYKLIGG